MHISDAFQDIRLMLDERLQQKGWGISVSRHEVLGILTEEMLELLDATREHGPEAVTHFRDELLDIAVGAILGICSIDTGKMDW